MSKPIAGRFYSVVKGDRIRDLSFMAYGYDNSANIVSANSKLLARPGTSLEGLPFIYDGDKLWLPPEKPKVKPVSETIDAKSGTEVSIRLNGTIYRGWTANSIKRSMNAIADAFTFQAPFNPDDIESRDLDPYTYYSAELFIGGQLYISGTCEKWNPSLGTEANMTSIECRSKGGVLNDCTSQEKSLNFATQSLKQIAQILLMPFGLIVEFPIDYTNALLNKTKRNITDKIGPYLAKLAKQAGYILNSTVTGGIKFDRANTEGRPIMTLVQGQPPLIGLSGTYDGSKRYSEYEAISQTNGQPGNKALEQDFSIPVFRPIIFSAKDTNSGNISDAAKSEKSRRLASSTRLTAVIATWRDEYNDLIFENNIITLIAPGVHVYNESRFLIEDVDLGETEGGGKTATLTLVAPESYTLKFPTFFWWTR